MNRWCSNFHCDSAKTEKILAEIYKLSGIYYDPKVVEILITGVQSGKINLMGE
jgi:response regulator RpfG family c-di-GMP phosphodiesterase